MRQDLDLSNMSIWEFGVCIFYLDKCLKVKFDLKIPLELKHHSDLSLLPSIVTRYNITSQVPNGRRESNSRNV